MKDDLVNRAVMILAKQGISPILEDGKVCFVTLESPGGPWVYLKYSNRNCTMLRTFVYECVSKQLPKDEQFIPSECQDCYKVVARPESLKDLMVLKDTMKEMGFASKCGIERRDTVDALYGGYWYCEGLDEGILRLKQVGEALSETEIPFFLKRGCTEYEQTFGPSDSWEVKDNQLAIEEEVRKRVKIDNKKNPQLKKDIAEIIVSWESWAAELGPDYTGSHNYVTYGGGNDS